MQVSSELRMGMLEQTAVSGSDTSVREEVVSRMARYQAAQKAYDAAVEGDGLGVRCLVCAKNQPAEFVLRLATDRLDPSSSSWTSPQPPRAPPRAVRR